MTVRIPIHNDSDYVAIKIINSDSPATDLFCLKAEVFKKSDPTKCDVSDKLFFENLILSDRSKPVNREIYSGIIKLVDKNNANFTITRDKEGMLCVCISPKE